jgi:uncharacterized protein (DUF427 family)
MEATWRGPTLAESEDTIVVEGNHYFPADSINRKNFRESSARSICPWKDEASYYHVVADQGVNKDAAWYYSQPKDAAANIKGWIAFWKGVVVE